MKVNQFNNLILFSLIMWSDKNYESSPDYIKENYFRFFNGKPDKMNVITAFDKRSKDVDDFFTKLMKRWRITKDDEDFDIYYISIMLTLICTTGNIDNILNYFNTFYKSSDSLKNELKEYYAHVIIRQKLVLFQNNNSRFFKLLNLKERIENKKMFEPK